MVRIYGVFIWCVYMVRVYGAFIWCVYMVHVYGAFIWCVYIIRHVVCSVRRTSRIFLEQGPIDKKGHT